MTAPQSTITVAPSFARGMRNTARSCLGNRWAPLAFAGLAAGIGLYFGGWAWLVAVGAAPIILSTLPCLIMCGLGVCMMCKGQKQSAVPRDAADATTSSISLTAANVDGQPVVGSSCCHEQTDETPSPQIKQLQSIKETGDLHA
jgi:hypothetical protein